MQLKETFTSLHDDYYVEYLKTIRNEKKLLFSTAEIKEPNVRVSIVNKFSRKKTVNTCRQI